MPVMLQDKVSRLRGVLADMHSVLVAYSGGVDSTVVLRIAHDALGERAVGVTAVSPTFPALELAGAKAAAAAMGARHEIVHTDQLAMPEFTLNDATRCFHCKTDLYRLLSALREQRGFAAVVDGTNLDDLGDDRPGLAAARQWGVRSPLVEAGFSKMDVRLAAKELGLPNWDKPAAACLSSRIPRGITITRERLSRVEQAEALLHAEGLRSYRVRDHGDIARIEVEPAEMPLLMDADRRARVSAQLKRLGFRFVTVDLEGYRRGGAALG